MAIWTPANITTELWLDANDSGTVHVTDTDKVDTWDDKSGNNRDMAGSGTARPDNTGTINGKTALNFDGSNDILNGDAGWQAFINSTEYTIFAVVKCDNTSGVNFFCGSNGSASADKRLHIGWRDLNTFTLAHFFDGEDWDGLTRDTNANMYSVKYTDPDSAFWINGHLQTIGVNPANDLNTDGVFQVGGYAGSNFWNGLIAEIVIVKGTLSGNDREKIEGYLAWKWGLESELPVSHHYRWNGSLFGFNGLWTPEQGETALWLDAADTITVHKNSSDQVLQWDDKSKNGNDVTQGTVDRSPITNSRTINDENALDFDGSNDRLEGPKPDWLNGTEYTVFAVIKDDTTTGTRFILGTVQAALDKGLHIGWENGDTWTLSHWADGKDWDGLTRDTNDHMYTSKYTDPDSEFWIDGDSQGTGVKPDNDLNTDNGFRVGQGFGGNYWNGLIGEVIIVTGTLSDADREKFEGYLAWKWGLQDNLPVGHTYETAAPTYTYDFSLTHSKKIHIQNVDAGIGADLEEYPSFVDQKQVDATFWANAQDGGGDIVCSLDEAGLIPIPIEVVDCDTTGETLELWVEIDLPDLGGLDVFIWYDTPGADVQPFRTTDYGAGSVWDDDNAMVHHLTDLSDSSGNNLPMTTAGGATPSGSGISGGCYDFEAGDVDSMQKDDVLYNTSTWTIEIFFKMESSGAIRSLFGTRKSGGEFTFGGRISNPATELDGRVGDGASTWLSSTLDKSGISPALNDGEWHMVAWTIADSGDAWTLVLDGVEVASGTFTAGTPAFMRTDVSPLLQLGTDYNGTGDPFDGLLDEFRLSWIVRAEEWLKATYLNVIDTENIWLVGGLVSGRDHAVGVGANRGISRGVM